MYAAIALCGLLVLAPDARAADSVAAAVRKRYASIQGMRAEFIQVLEHRESGGKEERRGVLYFAKPLKVRWETTSPVPELLLVTPEAVWNVFPEEGAAYKYPADLSGEAGSVVRIVTGQSDLEKDFSTENKGTDNGLVSLTLYPKNPTPSMTEVELTAEAKTGIIKSVTVIDFYNNRNAITFTSQTVDPSPEAALFVFTPAKGMRVEDRTKEGVTAKPLMR
jgi:outer membrane lipoprotein carrier protein